MTEVVGVYARISEDPLGLEKGVKRQVADCRGPCGQRGWRIGDEFVDNDLSALKGGPRPEYERLMEAVAAARSRGSWRSRCLGCGATVASASRRSRS